MSEHLRRDRPDRASGVVRHSRRLWFCALALLLAASASARDAYVILSGGGTPLSNNYSQFLQARGVLDGLHRAYPAGSIWVFFGAGNRPGEPARMADVHRQLKEGGLLRDAWFAGALPGNRPATKAVFLSALAQEILPAVRSGGTLYLFVGDHGSQTNTEPKESVITLWQMATKGARASDWYTDEAEVLSVSELRLALASGLGRGRVVFCMTQCYSGGFHSLGAARRIEPNPDWFRSVPQWAASQGGPAMLAVAGFTSTDDHSMAAGCDPDPDPEQWAGYERFAPEALLGMDLLSGRRVGPRLPSFGAAHEAATARDATIDKPRSSSEQYLEHWALLIERMATEPMLADSPRAAVAAYRREVDTGLAQANDPEFSALRERYRLLISGMGELNPAVAALTGHGTVSDLKRAMGMHSRRGPRPNPGAPRLWKEVLRPAWKAAVESGQVAGLSGEALAFERYLLAQEDRGKNLLFPTDWQDPMLNDLYWRSSYAFPSSLDQAKAVAVTRWGAQRRGRIAEWAGNSADPVLRNAARALSKESKNRESNTEESRTLPAETAAERTLFYRRVLAAWAFLMAMDEQTALARLHELLEIELTPFPPTASARIRGAEPATECP